MSWRASAYIKQLQNCPNGEPISRGEKLIGLILADSHQDKVGAYTFPSVVTLAEDGLMNERTCRRTLSSLERKGVIRRVRRENQGRGQFTFYSFPELDDDHGDPDEKGGQNVTLSHKKKGGTVSPFLRPKGGQKGDNPSTALEGTETQVQKQKQKLPPHVPPANAGGSSVAGSLFAGQFADRDERETGPPGADEHAVEHAAHAVEHAIEQTMNACAWTKRRLRAKVRAVVLLELDKGTPPATTALAIMAAWKFQTKNSHLLRGKFGPANFLELGIWKDANLLQWDHQRMDRERNRDQNGGRL